MELVSLLISIFAVGFCLGNLLRGISDNQKLPKWKKSQSFEHSGTIHQIVIRDGKMFASSTKEIGEWFLDLSELEKLPKEEINKNKKTQELFSIARKEVEKDLAKV